MTFKTVFPTPYISSEDGMSLKQMLRRRASCTEAERYSYRRNTMAQKTHDVDMRRIDQESSAMTQSVNKQQVILERRLATLKQKQTQIRQDRGRDDLIRKDDVNQCQCDISAPNRGHSTDNKKHLPKINPCIDRLPSIKQTNGFIKLDNLVNNSQKHYIDTSLTNTCKYCSGRNGLHQEYCGFSLKEVNRQNDILPRIIVNGSDRDSKPLFCEKIKTTKTHFHDFRVRPNSKKQEKKHCDYCDLHGKFKHDTDFVNVEKSNIYSSLPIHFEKAKRDSMQYEHDTLFKWLGISRIKKSKRLCLSIFRPSKPTRIEIPEQNDSYKRIRRNSFPRE